MSRGRSCLYVFFKGAKDLGRIDETDSGLVELRKRNGDAISFEESASLYDKSSD